jgi:hypothetical protein
MQILSTAKLMKLLIQRKCITSRGLISKYWLGSCFVVGTGHKMVNINKTTVLKAYVKIERNRKRSRKSNKMLAVDHGHRELHQQGEGSALCSNADSLVYKVIW